MDIETKKSLVRLIGTLRSCCDINSRWHPQKHRLPYGADDDDDDDDDDDNDAPTIDVA